MFHVDDEIQFKIIDFTSSYWADVSSNQDDFLINAWGLFLTDAL